MGREKRDVSPVILKFGLALAFSLGGMLYTFIRNRRIKPSQSSSDSSRSADCNDHGILRRSSKGDHHASHKTPNSCQFDPLGTDKHNSLSDKDCYLLPEFNDLMKELDFTAFKTNHELPISDGDSPKLNSMVETDSREQELKNLKNMIKMLKERERSSEVQLLEYYGLKEQQTAVMELQNRLKLNSIEAKLFALKIESLETDNKKLESEIADYNKVLTDLEAAQAKIKVLKKKLRSESALNKERILDLQRRVEKMQEDEHNRDVGIDPEIEFKLCKLKELEDEVNELRKSNYNLQVEKSELTQRLEQVQILATSVLEDEEVQIVKPVKPGRQTDPLNLAGLRERLKQEGEHLKKQNEELTKEIEQLQADRCSDVEELVYMRWINACLRFELRNYQPEPGQTTARDLSKTLSPRSEEKAKRLILEYANQELDSDHWSSPQSSTPMDSGELIEPFIDHPSSRKRNHKFFGKFVKFLRSKDENRPDHHHYHHDHRVRDYNDRHNKRSHSRNSSLEQTDTTGDELNSYTDYSFGCVGNSSMDSQRSTHRHSDLGIYGRIDSIAEGGDIDDRFSASPYTSDGEKSELVKYAEVLQDSNLKPPIRYRRRLRPFSSF